VNAKSLAKNYASLTPKERFCLILAAAGRGDDAEQERLVNAAAKLTLFGPDHWPYSSAFDELAMAIFCELLAAALNYSDAWQEADNSYPADALSGDEAEEAEGGAAEADEAGEEPEEDATAGPATDDGKRPVWERAEQLALAFGYTLRTKANGWKLFCERLNIPPYLMWERLPGFDRLKRALALADELAFAPEGFLRWLNTIRPECEPQLTEVPLTVEGIADGTERLFRERVAWWSGETP
jgi:hypothetical protein